jgi:hypothetical protein
MTAFLWMPRPKPAIGRAFWELRRSGGCGPVLAKLLNSFGLFKLRPEEYLWTLQTTPKSRFPIIAI